MDDIEILFNDLTLLISLLYSLVFIVPYGSSVPTNFTHRYSVVTNQLGFKVNCLPDFIEGLQSKVVGIQKPEKPLIKIK